MNSRPVSRRSLAAGWLALLSATAGAWLVGCSNDGPSEPLREAADDTPLEHAEKHLDPLYRCPMHPQITSDEPGDCPICGMDLVLVDRPTAAKPGADRVTSGREPLFYRNPMDPSITSETPRKDEMGMDYIPVYAEDLEDTIEISPAVLQNLGVRYATAERGTLPAEVTAVGYVEYDERTLREVRIRAEGWVEQLAVRAAGDPVRAGQRLFEIYSPTLATAEAELAQAVEFGDEALIAASERRLAALGVDRATIERLRQGGDPAARLAFTAPIAGVIDQLAVREGARVAPDSLAMRIVALDPIWVIVEVPESSLALVRRGAPVELEPVALPGRRFEGSVDYVYPQLDPATRTGRVRVVLENPEAVLLPDMYVTARIQGPAGEPVVHVPLESVIRGGRADRVIVALGDGRFEAREVRVGREAEERIAILDGLAPGERVVASGVFLIDSEASLRSSLSRLESPAASGHEGNAVTEGSTQRRRDGEAGVNDDGGSGAEHRHDGHDHAEHTPAGDSSPEHEMTDHSGH
ncbi:MAG TPA: efflux RND transporter periplasmic adaptor subunit [Steroidobacteraceae bacterium]|nr:efflux RND transporter periplasmic adaptor subunit [Steroidobacteraceae bacterium]